MIMRSMLVPFISPLFQSYQPTMLKPQYLQVAYVTVILVGTWKRYMNSIVTLFKETREMSKVCLHVYK